MFCWRPGGSERSSEDPEMCSGCLRANDSGLQDIMDMNSRMSHVLFGYVEWSRAGMLWFKTFQSHDNSQHIPSGQSLEPPRPCPIHYQCLDRLPSFPHPDCPAFAS